MHRCWIAAISAALGGCPAEAPPACIDVEVDCQELYEPTFDNVYSRTLRDGCGSQRVACHSSEGMKGGMSFEDPDTAHAALLAGRVRAGDPSCSLMIVRTSSPGTDYQMPPGSPLSAAERCALIKWVAGGALGPGQGAAP